MSIAEARAAREKINLAAAVGGASAVMAELQKRIAHEPAVTPEDCMQIAADITRERAIEYLRNWIYPSLHGMWIAYCVSVGSPPAEDEKLYLKDSWADGLDDQLEKFCEPHHWLLSSDWMGRYTISNQLYNEEALRNWADAFAVEVYKNITFKHSDDPSNDEGEPKTAAQIMSAVGILGKDIQTMLATRTKPTPKQVEEHKMSTLQETITKANMWVAMTGMNDGQVAQLLDNASDSDDGLASSGVSSLGCTAEDIPQFRAMRSTMTLEQMAALIRSGAVPIASPPALPPIPAPPMNGGPPIPLVPTLPPIPLQSPPLQGGVILPPAPAEAPPAPAKRTRGSEKTAPGNAVPARCLAILKDHTGLKTEDLGAGLGVSRGTFDNYVKGKAHLIPSTEHLMFLAKIIDDRLAMLTEARNMLPKP